jgi:hypothetical protein
MYIVIFRCSKKTIAASFFILNKVKMSYTTKLYFTKGNADYTALGDGWAYHMVHYF